MNIILFTEIISVLIGISINLVTSYSNGHRNSDICSHWNGRRHFIELGERGELHAFNTSAPAFRNSIYAPLNISDRIINNWYQCNLELVTCAECVIRVTITFANFSKTCEKSSNAPAKLKTRCPCEHIVFSEEPYDIDVSGQYFCGDGKVFRSRTRTLLLKFFYKANHNHVFSLNYYSERNVKIISGSPRQSIVSNYTHQSPQIISTPYFPSSYPRDYGIEHILTCEAENCLVRLDFTDFQIGLTSTLEVFDSNGQMLDCFTGEHFRPPIIISSGKSLLLTFKGNGAPGLGFKAEVNFISSKQANERDTLPFTDCGGMVEGPGGAITMMNMLENGTEVRLYDCIWIIKPLNNYMMMKTHILLRVDALFGMASRSELIIREGTTSDAPEIEKLIWPNNGLSKRNHIAPVISGFYIRLKGVFGISSRLAIVYSVFNYMNCYIGSEFLCQNNHCISVRLHCDGFDHCGDNSDEPGTCEEEWSNVGGDRKWYTHKPNYYFPKIEQYPDLRTATGIFIMSTLGILLVLSGWMVLLYRMGVRSRHQRQLQNHLQTISELLDRQEEIPIDDPPDYEAPPDYEEVIKIGMDDEMNTPHRRRRRHARRNQPEHSRNCNREPTCSNAITAPSPSTLEIQRQSENLQDIANRMLSTASICETAEAGSTRQTRCRDSYGNTQTPENSLQPIDANAFPSMQQFLSNYSLKTTTPIEENSAEFKDDSFNVSLSLAISQTPIINSSNNQKTFSAKNTEYTENSLLKKSWILFQSDSANTERKLRHTFSTPEALLTNGLLRGEMNYGSYLTSDRNSFLSNASTFASDIPSDDILGSPQQFDDYVEASNLIGDHLSNTNQSKIQDIEIKELYNPISAASCFGNVNLLASAKQQKRNGRSKSFSQSENRRNDQLKRCSSVDLLLPVIFRLQK